MLRFQSTSYLISVPDKLTEVCIYATDHFKDENGQRFDAPPPHDRFSIYGDIYIETPFTRYIFRDVKSAYSYPAKINKIINEQKYMYLITIDLDEMYGGNGFHAEGGLEIIAKAQTINLQVEDYEELPF